MDWTAAPLVALVLCSPLPGPTDDMPCVHYTSKPYVTCMRMATAMNQSRRSEDSPLAACIRLELARKMPPVLDETRFALKAKRGYK